MLKKILFSTLLTAAILSPFAQAQLKYLPGRDYAILQQTIEEEKAEAPKVIEFFWYGCPHCYHFEESLTRWLGSDKSAGITFEKVPAVTEHWEGGARMYYTAHILKLPDIDTKIFEAVHKYRNNAILFDKNKALDFLVANGADKATAERTWDSLLVSQKVARAKKLFDDSGLSGVPSALVNGVYTVSIRNDYEQFLDILSILSRQKTH